MGASYGPKITFDVPTIYRLKAEWATFHFWIQCYSKKTYVTANNFRSMYASKKFMGSRERSDDYHSHLRNGDK